MKSGQKEMAQLPGPVQWVNASLAPSFAIHWRLIFEMTCEVLAVVISISRPGNLASERFSHSGSHGYWRGESRIELSWWKNTQESPSGKYFGSFAIVQHRLPGILRESPPAYSVAPRWWGICPDLGLPWRLKTVKNLLSGQERLRFNPWVGKISGEGNGNPLQYSCLENPCGWRSLVGYSPWCHKRVGRDWATNTPNPIQTHCMRRPVAPYPCKTLDVFILVILAILMSILQHLIEVLVCISC